MHKTKFPAAVPPLLQPQTQQQSLFPAAAAATASNPAAFVEIAAIAAIAAQLASNYAPKRFFYFSGKIPRKP